MKLGFHVVNVLAFALLLSANNSLASLISLVPEGYRAHPQAW
jgi:hypothetical protein